MNRRITREHEIIRQARMQLGLSQQQVANMPYSLHRLKDYHAGGLVVAPMAQKTAEESLYIRGERPEALVDYPVSATDYELVDLFNWQEEATGMLSQMEFVRRVDVQSETVEHYIQEGKIQPDIVVPMSEHRSFKYFKEETLVASAEQYGRTLINDDNRKTIFMNMIQCMDMTYSYKPVLIMAMLAFSDSKGRVKLSDIVLYFRRFYSDRRRQGLMIERSNSIYCREDITDKQIERHILMKPFRRFEEMHMMRHTKTLGIIEMDNSVWKRLTEEEKTEIKGICEEKLGLYYRRIEEQP